MAAGLGTRLRPFTEKVAKPLLPLMGIPVAQFAFDQLKRTSISKIVANVHHLATASSQALRFLDAPAPIEISDESDLLLGSAGGLAKAAPLFKGEPFFILNADTLCNSHLQDLAKHHLLLKHQYSVTLTLLLFKRAPTLGNYREILVDDRRSLIRGIGEARQHRVFYAGAGILEPSCLKDVDPSSPSEFVPKILEPAIRAGRAGAFLFDNSLEFDNARWFDIGSPELWHQTHLDWMRLYEEGELPSIWSERILKANRRIRPNVWVSHRAPENIDTSQWGAPAYWAPEGSDNEAPKVLAARTILYGRSPFSSITTPVSGIGYRGLWKTL
ncbi:MAG: NTP transferase domain-containing protein [Cryobacterium sp.]|nr:NTP transferase domain-containing protein [Oligoflexia bacterium]